MCNISSVISESSVSSESSVNSVNSVDSVSSVSNLSSVSNISSVNSLSDSSLKRCATSISDGIFRSWKTAVSASVECDSSKRSDSLRAV